MVVGELLFLILEEFWEDKEAYVQHIRLVLGWVLHYFLKSRVIFSLSVGVSDCKGDIKFRSIQYIWQVGRYL